MVIGSGSRRRRSPVGARGIRLTQGEILYKARERHGDVEMCEVQTSKSIGIVAGVCASNCAGESSLEGMGGKMSMWQFVSREDGDGTKKGWLREVAFAGNRSLYATERREGLQRRKRKCLSQLKKTGSTGSMQAQIIGLGNSLRDKYYVVLRGTQRSDSVSEFGVMPALKMQFSNHLERISKGNYHSGAGGWRKFLQDWTAAADVSFRHLATSPQASSREV